MSAINSTSTPPLLFLSHDSEHDGPLADALIELVDNCYANSLRYFYSSGGSIYKGDDWRKVIKDKIVDSRVVLVLLTPQSVTRPWVQFEAGASWLYYETQRKAQIDAKPKEAAVIPCLFNLKKYPTTLSQYNACDLQSAKSLKELFTTLSEISDFRPKPIPSDTAIKKFLEVTAGFITPPSAAKSSPLPVATQSVVPAPPVISENEDKLVDLLQHFFRTDARTGRELADALAYADLISEKSRRKFLK